MQQSKFSLPVTTTESTSVAHRVIFVWWWFGQQSCVKLEEKCCYFVWAMLTRERERDQCLKSCSAPIMWGWPDSPQPSNCLINDSNLLWSIKCIYPSQTKLYTFFLNLLFLCPLRPLSCFYRQPQNLMPFSMHDHPLSPTHWLYQVSLFTIANWSIVSIKPNSFYVFELHSTHFSHHRYLCPS